MLRRITTEDPDRPAIVGRDARMTYGELHADSRRTSTALAHALADACATATSGAHPPLPPVIAICLSTAFDTARAVVAVEAGARILTVIDAHWPVALQMQLIVTTGAAAVITDVPTIRAALHSAGWSGLVIGLDDLARTPSPASTHAEASADDAPFLMLTSSGTTGPPKAFLKTRRQYAANIDVSRDHLGARDGVATFAPGPLSYSLTLYTLF